MTADILELLYNFSILVTLSLISGLILQRWHLQLRGNLFQGLLFGGAAVVGMMRPLVLGPGLIFDGRSVMISLCGLFFGPMAVGIAAFIALLYRVFWIGGAGALMGGLVILASSLLSLIFHGRWTRKGVSLTALRLWGVGLLVHGVMVLLMLTLPANTSMGVITHLGLPVLLAYPLATVLIGKLLAGQEASFQSMQALRLSEKALSDRAAQLRTLFNTIPDLIWLKEPDGTYMACNSRFELFFGAREQDIVGKTDFDFVDRELAELFRENDLRAIASAGPTTNEESIIFASDGHREDLETIKTPVFGQDREIIGVLGIGRNITERRVREHELESINRYFDMLSQVGQALLRAQSREGLLQDICDIAVERGGFQLAWVGWVDPLTHRVTPVAQAGKPISYLDGLSIYADERPEGQGPAGICLREDRAYVCRDFALDPATTLWRERAESFGIRGLAALPIHCREQVVGALMVYTDAPGALNDRGIALLEEAAMHISFGLDHLASAELHEQLQAELQKSQKMESLGSLAGGIAHDMNNVLSAILGLASANLASQPAESPAHRAFQTISLAAVRGGEMVKNLLSFSRQSPAVERELDINAILQEQVRLLEHTTFSKVQLKMELASDLQHIRGDASALTHAFMNLCVNAVDAMPNKGTLTLRTHNVDDAWIEVLVEDTGVGMPREVLGKALDPFFTTKEVGKGTGLGLSLVYSTVKAHQGQIEIESEPGLGTRVRIRFPACRTAPRVLSSSEEPPSGPSGLGLDVLLVDDDDLVRYATQATLEALGHRVTASSSGEAAVAMLESGFQPGLVLLDMNMPGMGGSGTLPRLRALCPVTPVLLCTGRVDQAALDLAGSYPGVTILSKPFTLRDLEQHLDTLRQAG